MDLLKRKRTQQRRDFTISADELQHLLDVKADMLDIEVCFANFVEAVDSLFATEEVVRSKWLEETDFNESAYQNDQDKFITYRKRWVLLKTLYQKLVKADSKSSSSMTTATERKDGKDESGKRHLMLPKLELAKFDGNIKHWIPFWGQYRKIHNDDTLTNDDKFQYLLQSMTPNSSARQLVESYPPFGENYPKAVDALKARFARDDLLIECYVRDLQNLVLLQAKGQQYDLRALYDKLQTQLQALDTLGVTKDKYAAMLLPMVESALPEEILRTWNRSRTSVGNPKHDELTNLLLFLKREVDSEERIEMARNGYSQVATPSSNVPTMACFTASNEKKDRPKGQKEERLSCFWCDKQNHSSSDCHKAIKMSLDERREYIKKKQGCEICLRTNHQKKKCKSHPKCLFCKERHLTLMCPKLAEEEDTKSSKEVLLCKKGSTLLPTLQVQVCSGDISVTVRALIDTGAQRSFLKENVAKELKLKPIAREQISHSLFGGLETKTEERLVYSFNIKSFDNKFVSEMQAIGEKNICGTLPKVNNQTLFDKLRQHGVELTEYVDDSPNDISLLIGADFSGQLLTSDIVQIDELTAIKTRLGWTLQGPITECTDKMTMLFCVSKLDISDLWNLETLGIKDPAEQCLKSTHDQQVLKIFNDTIQVNDEGRYEVQLPWRDMPRPQTNFEQSRKRLDSTYRRLQQLGKVDLYDAVFKEWLSLDIIEEAPDQEVSGHYMPHHAVFKENSLTTKIRPVFNASAKDSHGISLNSCLEKGANLLELIPQLLIDFRKGAIGVTADIAKAFLQISLNTEDREYLKFLWWTNSGDGEKKLITYRHKRVVFGVTSSPFHLVATLRFHLDNCPKELKGTADKLKKSFYVDNCVSSVESEDDMHKFVKESKELMSNGKFDLRQWVTAPVKIDRCG